MKKVQFVDKHVTVTPEGDFTIQDNEYTIDITPRPVKLGVMVVGLGGNNGSTLVAGLLAHRNNVSWNTTQGPQTAKFYGSMSQCGSVHIGYDVEGNPHSRLYKDVSDMCHPDDIVVGGWDICKDNLYQAAIKAKVIDYNLMRKLQRELTDIIPLPSIYNPDFIATNQAPRATNIISQGPQGLRGLVDHVVADISTFRDTHHVDKVVVLWCASTERFNHGKWTTKEDLEEALYEGDPEISPSILFAMAAAQAGCIFINGSPQNTLCPAVIAHAHHHGTHVGGEDFKTGQTKIKSVLADWLVTGGIKPLSIVSYNHLGNNDGKNLDEDPQFRSKEITKKNVIDDVVAENPTLFPHGEAPDHSVVIKYIPAVGDSKRAMDEYYSELFLGGRHTLSMHNTCEDSLLAVPIIIDIILFADLFSRLQVSSDGAEPQPFDTVLSLLSLFFKAPVTNRGEPLVNAFFRQKTSIESLFRILIGLPPANHLYLGQRTRDPD